MNRRIRILHVNKFYAPHIGGIETAVQDLAEGLQDRVDTRVLVCQSRGRGRDEQRGERVHIRRASSLGIYFSMPVSLTLPFLLAQEQPDIIHYHLPFPLGTIAHLLVRPQARTVVTWYCDIVRQKRLLRLYSGLLRSFLQRIDRIIVIAPQLLDNSPFLQEVRDKCVVIPLGIDHERFASTPAIAREAMAIRARYGGPLILAIGRMVYYKGFEYLIDAMKHVPDARLLLIGTGPLEAELRARAGEQLDERIHFVKPVADEALPAYYHACDLFVLPSVATSEAYGLVQLEAMACGKAVVSTNLPTGVPFVNQHGQTGLVVPPLDTAALAAAINELLADEPRRLAMGSYARERVIASFDRRQLIGRTYEIYQELLGIPQGSSSLSG